MNCNKCSDKPKTVGWVQGCKFCLADGTANEIPKDLGANTPLSRAVELKPGLGNRFSPDRAERPAAGPVDANLERVRSGHEGTTSERDANVERARKGQELQDRRSRSKAKRAPARSQSSTKAKGSTSRAGSKKKHP